MTMISPVGFAKQVTEAYRTSEPSAVGAPDFASMIGQAAQNAIHTVREAEQVTAAGVAGKADTQAVVQALTTAIFGPLSPCMIDSWPEIMLMMVPGTKNGEILRGPPAINASCVVSINGRPPIPEPMQTPICSRAYLSRSMPESFNASIPAASP